jgi:hypothetical protein
MRTRRIVVVSRFAVREATVFLTAIKVLEALSMRKASTADVSPFDIVGFEVAVRGSTDEAKRFVASKILTATAGGAFFSVYNARCTTRLDQIEPRCACCIRIASAVS